MKFNRIIYTTLFILITIFQLNAQDDPYAEKVRKMLELSGAAANFNVAITNMIDLQKEAFGEILPEEFFIEMEKEMLEVGFEKLIPRYVPIYRRHLTEEDLDGIITFYESEVGRKLTAKMPMILSEAMQMGAEWGEELALEIFEKVQNSNEYLFKTELYDDCSKFKEGTFEAKLEGQDEVFFIEQKNGVYTEKYQGQQFEYKVQWTGNNQYTLEAKSAKISEQPITEVTIYEVNENSYKYIARQNGLFTKGSMKLIDRKM